MQENLDNIKKINDAKKEVLATDQRISDLADARLQSAKKSVEFEKEFSSISKQSLKFVEKRTNELQIQDKTLSSLVSVYNKLDKSTKKQLSETKKYSDVVKDLNSEIIRQSSIEATNNGIVKQQAQERLDILNKISDVLQSQIKSTIDAEAGLASQSNQNLKPLQNRTKELQLQEKTLLSLAGITDNLASQTKITTEAERGLTSQSNDTLNSVQSQNTVFQSLKKTVLSLIGISSGLTDSVQTTTQAAEGLTSQSNDTLRLIQNQSKEFENQTKSVSSLIDTSAGLVSNSQKVADTLVSQSQNMVDSERGLTSQSNDTLTSIQTRSKELQSQEKTLSSLTDISSGLASQSERPVESEKELNSLNKISLKAMEKKRKELEIQDRTLSSLVDSYNKLDDSVKRQLKEIKGFTGAVQDLNAEITRQTVIEETNSGVVKQQAQERLDILNKISDDLISQAQSTARVKDEVQGLTEFDIQRRTLMENQANLSKDALASALDGVNATEALYKKEQQLTSIKESQQSLYDSMPESLKSAVDFGKQLFSTLKNAGTAAMGFMILASLVAATVIAFTSLDEAAADFRKETGLTNSQMEELNGLVNNVVKDYAQLGINASAVFGTVAALRSEFADFASFSESTVAALSVLGANFGVSAENAAKVQSIMEGIGGLSSDTAANVQLQVAEMANLAGVAPAKVFEDIAGSAEAASTFFKGNVVALTQAAIEARRMGSNLAQTVSVAEKLLDFESSITSELEASAFLGGQFELSQARALAAAGDTVGAQKEILNQIQRTGDFREKDLWTQRAIAEASGMSVEEINKQLMIQERLNSLTGEQRKLAEQAIEQGLDISNVQEGQLVSRVKEFALQQEQQGAMERLSNQFNSIAMTLGTSIVPFVEQLVPLLNLAFLPIQAMAEGFSLIAGFLRENIVLASALGVVLVALNAKAIFGAVARIYSSIVGMLGPFGIPVAAATVLGMISMANKAMTNAKSVGDMIAPADGRTMVSTREGGLFELSPNDDLIAAPGIVNQMQQSPLSNVTAKMPETVNVQTQTNEEDKKGLKELLNEIRGLREDLKGGKVGVYMDGKKVTSSISRVVDRVGGNSYGLT